MSKKKNSNTYGRALIRDRFGKRKGKHGSDSFLHTSEMNDGYDWGRLNLQSVTEQSALDDFLTTAEMAGTEFTAERLNIKIIDVDKNAGIPSAEEVLKIQQLHSQYKESLSIPRRPLWDEQTTPEELNKRERESFLSWRRNLASLQEVDGLEITPYEKNLDFWRQLWRVIERSDLVVQIVDARNPLLFYCEDLEKYAKEVNSEKKCLLLINKADFLSQSQRQYWKDYFSKRHIQVAFWSAKLETERQNEDDSADDEETVSDEDAITEEEESDEDVAKIEENESNDSGCSKDTCENASELPYCTCVNSIQETMTSELCQKCGQVIKNQSLDTKVKSFVDRDEETDILSGEQLLDVFRKLKPQKTLKDELLTVGMVGYPNVGKSSTINAILHMKKVPVSSTPGRTKHFQTLCVDKDLMLCDCPGLVFPSFVSTKADLVINGILPIDQLRDHMPPVALICQKIPRDMLESCYSINLPLPQEGEDPERAPYAAELLNSYAYMRGFMTSKGIPDCSRAARIILKDFVSGKLVYCEPPPEISKETFQAAGLHSLKPKKSHSSLTPIPDSGVGMTSRLDRDFFSKESSVAHVRGVQQGQGHISSHGSQQRNSSISSSDGSMQSLVGKPWKKHKNNKKKEKLRKVFAHLDVTDKY